MVITAGKNYDQRRVGEATRVQLWFGCGADKARPPPHAGHQWSHKIAGDITVYWQSHVAIGGPHGGRGLGHRISAPQSECVASPLRHTAC